MSPLKINKMRLVIVAILALIPLHATSVFAGGGSTGGGELAPDGEPLDLYLEEHPMITQATTPQFNPITDPDTKAAVQQVLYPWLAKLEQRVPGSAAKILAGFEQMNWHYTDQPLQQNIDDCHFLKNGDRPEGHQVGDDVVLYRPWIKSSSPRWVAAMILHELAEHSSNKGPADCTNKVEDFVGMIDQMGKYTDDQLRQQFDSVVVGPGSRTRSEADQLKSLNILKSAQCVPGATKNQINGGFYTVDLTLPSVPPMGLYYDTTARLVFNTTYAYSLLPGKSSTVNTFIVANDDQRHGNDPYVFGFKSVSDCLGAIQSLRDEMGLPGNDSESALQNLLSASLEDSRHSSGSGSTKQTIEGTATQQPSGAANKAD